MGLETLGFDPARDFESVAEAIEFISQQPNPVAAAMAIVEVNIRRDEFGFASEVVRDMELVLYKEDINPAVTI